MYKRAIVDEVGEVVKWYSDFKNEHDIEKFLNEYPECTIRCIEV